ncbi:hypothetical protein GCM10007385_27180 [Tateyamaria omphalii]|uniref:hypothetical protein n=1 Tax=Tateyamaria omphalii TaxID=299262 RepID=UPI0016793E39|nr:hypothetical protein [Tateyamaria omphalii]GGX56949.1 hypothetical protein GCM10007385_27180 [Tateyamaria omphalii]
MPRQIVITTASLVVLAAFGGFWLGQRQVNVDASDVIAAVADAHVAKHGGDRRLCVGWPGDDGVVFFVRCVASLYAVDRWGRVSEIDQEGAI